MMKIRIINFNLRKDAANIKNSNQVVGIYFMEMNKEVNNINKINKIYIILIKYN